MSAAVVTRVSGMGRTVQGALDRACERAEQLGMIPVAGTLAVLGIETLSSFDGSEWLSVEVDIEARVEAPLVWPQGAGAVGKVLP